MSSVNKKIKIELVGLEESNRGCQCANHNICKNIITPGMLLRLQSIVINNDNGEDEDTIDIYAFYEGIQTCLVGFLRRFATKKKDFYDGKVVKVKTMNSLSSNKKVRERSHAMRGSAVAFVIE